MNLSERSTEPELMDTWDNPRDIRSAHSELRLINKFLGGNSISRAALEEIRRKFRLDKIHVLDAGSGTADIFYKKKNLPRLSVTAMDRNKFTCSLIKEKNHIDNIICGNVFFSPVKKKSFDVVHASLFLHHFDDARIFNVVKSFCGVSRHAVIINDLQRSYLAYISFKLLSSVFSKNLLVKNDGLVSVKRSFRRKELRMLLDSLNLKYRLRWKWAFRWSIIIYCNEIL